MWRIAVYILAFSSQIISLRHSLSMHSRLTQQDIARRAGVDRSTVSLALQNHPSLAQKTKDRIQELAREMGYKPDPMLAALAAYSSQKRTPHFEGSLAWIVNRNTPTTDWPDNDWRKVGLFLEYFNGAKAQALQRGYKLEEFELNEKHIGAERLARILRARNIRGVLLCPQPCAGVTMEFPYEDFSFVTYGHTLEKPLFHKIVTTQYQSMVTVMQKVRTAGYQRIGLMYSKHNGQRSSNNSLAGYLTEEFLHNPSSRIPPCDPSENSVRNWYLKYKPDAIVSANVTDGLSIIEKIGLKVPEDVGLAMPVLPDRSGRIAGIYENNIHMGRLAVDLLVSMIHTGDHGIPNVVHVMTVNGDWIPGDSLPPATSRKIRKNRQQAAT
jgi:LacI family transcriptional regulator/LacI family repressor for deo operon, udp, cdd, tsx, nupC, and nupG